MEEKSRSSALQAPLSMTKTEPPLSLEASVHVHSSCGASAHTLLLPEEGTVRLASGSWESSMSYFKVAWFVPLILRPVGLGALAVWNLLCRPG